jgi:hypothetical protein
MDTPQAKLVCRSEKGEPKPFLVIPAPLNDTDYLRALNHIIGEEQEEVDSRGLLTQITGSPWPAEEAAYPDDVATALEMLSFSGISIRNIDQYVTR